MANILWLIVISFIETSLLLAGFFSIPPEASGGILQGYSHLRMAALVILVVAWMGLAAAAGLMIKNKPPMWLCAAEAWLLKNDHLHHLVWILTGLMVIPVYGYIFTFITLPMGLRPFFAWMGLMLGQTAFFLRCTFRQVWKERGYHLRYRKLPRAANLDPKQKKILLTLSVMGLIYFMAFIPVNLQGTSSEHEFYLTGGDEYVIYPILTSIMTPGETARETVYRIIEYEDYHYGYPFYVASALVLLPVRLIDGSDFAEHYQINLLLLRQCVSILPIILSALIISYLGTRWRKWISAMLVFLLILSLPGVIRYNMIFWHPDGLTVLCVCLTLFFFDRDKLRFGIDFHTAAIFCGLAISIRLFGVFFFLAVAGLLVAGIWKKKLSFLRLISSAIVFLCIMATTVVVTNPFLFDPGARERMAATLSEKSHEMREGYDEPDPQDIYRTCWDAWLPFMTKDFGSGIFLAFLLISALAAAGFSTERVFPATLCAWVLALGGFLVYVVAVKLFQYMLPLFIPLYGSSFLFPQAITNVKIRPYLEWGFAGLCLMQLGLNLTSIIQLFEA